jgi:hypothetical protein
MFQILEIVEKVKRFFGSAGKLVFALFLAGVGLFAIVEIYSTTTTYFEKKSLEKYAVAKPWADDLSQVGLKVAGKRKYVDGVVLVTLTFIGYPEFLSDPILTKKNADESRGFLLKLKDADDFEIATLDIPLTSLTTIVGDDGKAIGLSGQRGELLAVEQYTRISSVDVVWTLDTEIPKPVVQPPRGAPIVQAPRADVRLDDSNTGDHCEPGISRSVRLKRLAQHGDVRLTGNDTYRAGSREVMFGFSGNVIYCN